MEIYRWSALLLSLVVAASGQMRSQSTAAQQSSGPGTAKAGTSAQQKSGPAVHPAIAAMFSLTR